MIFYISTLLLLIQAKVNWDYLDHGDDWMLHSSYKSSCSKTKKYQSPVDLGADNTITVDEADLYFFPKYVQTLVTLEKENVSLKATPIDPNSILGPMYTVSVDGLSVPYNATDIQFRSESEHTIRGKRFDLEVQINHKYMFTTSANRSSLAVLFEADDSAEPHPFLQQVIDNYNSESFQLDTSLLVSVSASIEPYYFYQGSFTYPPCSEKTQWVVLETPRKAPQYQIDFFYNLYHNNPDFSGEGNYRKTQSFDSTASGIGVFYRANPYQSH